MARFRVDLIVNAAAYTVPWPTEPTLTELADLLHERATQLTSYDLRLCGRDGGYFRIEADDHRTASGVRDCATLLRDLAEADRDRRFTVADSNGKTVGFSAGDITAVQMTVGV